ncbi:excisionase [Candidatus Skiveiella danica]|jgi:hypothetical protein|uniref:excisionase n=1 Tax=Candidatus Skiveiella danica TaxID=3386177 RepID=UPI0039B918DF
MIAVRYMTIKRFADWSGYTPDAIRTKVRDGVWREGLEFKRAPDGRVLIDVEGYNEWVESANSTVFGPARSQPSKSTFTTRVAAAERGSGLSPAPLT